MSTASIPLFTDASSNTTRMTFRITARKPDGSPLSDAELIVTLEGDGSFQPGFDSKRVLRETSAEGTAEVTWYRRSIFGRDVKATLAVTAPSSESQVSIEQTPARVPS